MYLIYIFISSAAISWVLILFSLKILKYFKAYQQIREEGPSSHDQKSSTLTMGGVGIIISIFILAYIFTDMESDVLALVLLAVGFGIIGFIDDLIKIKTGSNMGLSAWQKSAGQIFVSILFCIYLFAGGYNLGVTGILKSLHLNTIWMYIPFSIFLLVGVSNAYNLTDGLDGLAAGTGIIAFLSFGIVSQVCGYEESAAISIITAASLFGFLLFNYNPAKVFMGDAGSLGLGALLGGIALLTHKELLLLVLGGVFAVETLSVILQVASFKMTGKRIFKMAPIHHHFELSGLSERNVVFLFWSAAFMLGLIGIWIGCK